MTDRIFLTGATGLLGVEVLGRLLREQPDLRAFVLVRDLGKWSAVARERRLPIRRITPLRGDLTLPELGLGREAIRLLREEDAVIHLAGDIVFSRSLEEARSTNVEGTRRLLELSAGRRARFCYVSTAFVAGRRTGAIREADPGGQAGWVNTYEQSKWEAEQLVRESDRDFLILRPSTVVCDSAAGAVSQYNAVHRALRLFHSGLAPLIPGREESPVDLVTAEYVGTAISALARRSDLSRETLHLCAGARAAPLGELLDRCYGIWAEDPRWRRRAIARPALTDLPTYGIFEDAVEETGDPRLRQVARSLTHFAPQLALEKRFETRRADAALGTPAPDVTEFWDRMVRSLLRDHWGARAPAAAA